MEQFRQVVVRLQDTRPAATLQPGFRPRDHTGDGRSRGDDRQNLKGLN